MLVVGSIEPDKVALPAIALFALALLLGGALCSFDEARKSGRFRTHGSSPLPTGGR